MYFLLYLKTKCRLDKGNGIFNTILFRKIQEAANCSGLLVNFIYNSNKKDETTQFLYLINIDSVYS